MIDHLGIQVEDMAAATEFYDAVFATLGARRVMDFGQAIGYGIEGPDYWISLREDQVVNRPIHVAFKAQDQDAVRAFFDTAVALGAEVLHEPRLWPEYHPTYFGAFVRDPDGNNVEAVHHGTPA